MLNGICHVAIIYLQHRILLEEKQTVNPSITGNYFSYEARLSLHAVYDSKFSENSFIQYTIFQAKMQPKPLSYGSSKV